MVTQRDTSANWQLTWDDPTLFATLSGMALEDKRKHWGGVTHIITRSVPSTSSPGTYEAVFRLIRPREGQEMMDQTVLACFNSGEGYQTSVNLGLRGYESFRNDPYRDPTLAWNLENDCGVSFAALDPEADETLSSIFVASTLHALVDQQLKASGNRNTALEVSVPTREAFLSYAATGVVDTDHLTTPRLHQVIVSECARRAAPVNDQSAWTSNEYPQ